MMNRRRFFQSSVAAAVAYALPAPRLFALAQAASQAAGGLAAVKLDGSPTTIEQAALAELKGSLRGPLLVAGDPGYEEARRVLNRSIDRRPALVIQPTGVADVRNAVDFARERELLLAVKCGGHSYGGKSTCDGGMQVDLSRLRGVRIDPAARIAYVEGNGGEITSVNVRSGARSLLVRLPGENSDSISEIDWSPNGARLAVLSASMSNSTGRLYVMDADGSNVRVLAENLDARGVAWSPDGARLAYGEAAPDSGEVRIWVAYMDGAEQTKIGSASFGGCTYPYLCGLTWSPDGNKIGFGKAKAEDSAFAADAPGPAEPLDGLTFQSWAGGSWPTWD